MSTRFRLIVLLILTLILLISAWSKLRFLDANSDRPQRWRVEDFDRHRHPPEVGSD